MNARRAVSLATLLLLGAVTWGCRERARSDAVATWQVDTAAGLAIGSVEGDPAYQLYRVRGIVELPDGGIALANAGTSQIRIYDARGRFVRALGREGSGPGEFTGLLNLVARGDTLYAYDRMYGRLTRFLRSGTFLDDRSLHLAGGIMVPDFAGLLRAGALAAWLENISSSDGFQRDSAVLLRIGPDGTADTLGTFPGDELILHRRYLGGGAVAATAGSWSFFREFRAVAAGDRIYAAPTDSAVIYVWDGAGRPRGPLRWEDRPQPLDAAAARELVERETANLEPARREKERREAKDEPRPPAAPVFDRLLIGPDGELWVRRFDQAGAETSEWLVFGADGPLRAKVRIPREREIRAVGRARVYTVERDEYDVEYVRAYALHR